MLPLRHMLNAGIFFFLTFVLIVLVLLILLGPLWAWKKLAMDAVQVYIKGRYAEAVELSTHAIKLNPRASLPYSVRSLAYTALGQLVSAVSDADKAISLAPSSYQGYHSRALAFSHLGKHQSCVDDLTQALNTQGSESPPNPGILYNLRGLEFYEIADYKAARRDFDMAISLMRNSGSSYYGRAKTLLHLNENEKALSDLGKAIKFGENAVKTAALNDRVRLYMETNQLEKALPDLSEIIIGSPTNADALANRASVYAF